MVRYLLAASAIVALAAPMVAPAQDAGMPFENVQPDRFEMPGSLVNAWADFDRDGDLDLAVSGKTGEVRLYRNDGGRFVSVGATLGLPTGGYPINSLAWGDYDGDGWPDLQAGPTDKANLSLVFRNLRGRKFANVAAAIGLTMPGRSARHTNWIDFDNDGDLDLYATDRAGENRLYRNDGGVFTQLPSAQAPADTRPTVGACWFDYDRDGDLDVFLANQAGATDALYRNDGDHFTDVAAQLGIDHPGRDKSEGGVGCAVGDYDNDGHLDIFVPNYGHNSLYRGGADGRFADVAPALGLALENHAVGAGWGDYDNDGLSDLMVTSYVGGSGVQEPKDALFRNRGPAGFVDVLAGGGIVNASDHGVQWIDYDRDGALDLSLTKGFGKTGSHQVFRNIIGKPAARRSLSVLVLDATGLVVRPGAEVRLYDAKGRILATRLVETAGGYSSQSAGPVHFGLASLDPVTVEVTFMGKAGRHVVQRTGVRPSAYAGRSLVVKDTAR